MRSGIKDAVYERIAAKVKNGTFTEGKVSNFRQLYFERTWLEDIPMDKRTPEVCAGAINYSRGKLSDVPEKSITRDFLINTFSNDEVFEYIKNNIKDFDRQFFKDLIAANECLPYSDKNCFAIMPLEYIDEEMCTLAILNSLTWIDGKWLYTVNERKPEALTEDMWKLGARLYSRMSETQNQFLNVTPEEYKDEEYYKEMCLCNFNCGMPLKTNKGKIMNSIPEEIVTENFIRSLLDEDIESIAAFSEKALETFLEFNIGGVKVSEKVWQVIVRVNGYTIKYIDLNEERINFFFSIYDKDSGEYKWGIKDNYKKYLKDKESKENATEANRRTREFVQDSAIMTLVGALAYSMEGENPTKAIEDTTRIMSKVGENILPIKYKGIIPAELRKNYDSEEFLEMLYQTLGIEIVGEYDSLFYQVNLPSGWTKEQNGLWTDIKDEEGNVIIHYFYDSYIADRKAYVEKVYLPYTKSFDIQKRVLAKKNTSQKTSE